MPDGWLTPYSFAPPVAAVKPQNTIGCAALCTDTGADRLKDEGDAISAVAIVAAQVKVEFKIEWLVEANFVDIPHRSGLPELIRR